MTRVLVTQRVAVDPATGERRDALDQRWHAFLDACGIAATVVPNHGPSAARLAADGAYEGLLLTGGNDLVAYGGDAPERDAVERGLVDAALALGRPVLGVCRGMQLLLDRAGVPLVEVEGHVAERQVVRIDGERAEVNSYHRLGSRDAGPEFAVFAVAQDGVVEGVRHRALPLVGVLWHPERLDPFRPGDVALFRSVFAGGSGR